MENNLLKQQVEELAALVDGEVEESLGELVLKVKASSIMRSLMTVKNFPNMPCDFLHDLFGMDLVDHLEVVYQLTSLHGPQRMRIKAIVDRDIPEIESATSIWQGANFLERETYDMFGIKFSGHPNLKRIYLWDDFEGFPMRKDYVTEPIEVRDVMRVRREGE